MNKYLSRKDIMAKVGEFKFSEIKMASTDTYSEKEVLASVMTTGSSKELGHVALQLAMIGYGSKEFKTYFYKGSERKIGDLFRKCNVKSGLNIGAKLKPGDITPRRLIRLFRFHTQDYILKSGTPSYLWQKYNNTKGFEKAVFPGAEHLVTKFREAYQLYKAYYLLDEHLKEIGRVSGICKRIERVMMARNLDIKKIKETLMKELS